MRKKSTYKIIVLLFLSAVFVCTIAACSSKIQWLKQGDINSATARTTPLSLVQKPTATKIVNHALGQVEIPLHPQRIAVLDGEGFLLDSLLALGIKPVGILRCSNCVHSDAYDEFVSDVPVVGSEQPSLEKILSLKPDLILGYA